MARRQHRGKGGFQFKDRSGKVHAFGERPERSEQPRKKETHSKSKSHAKLHKKHEEKKGRDRDRSRRPQSGGVRKVKATLDKNQKGFGFLIFEDRTIEDAFLPPREAQSLFHGDRLEVTVSPRGEVMQIQVLQHRFRELVGRFTPHPMGGARGGWIVYERKRTREEVFVPQIPAQLKIRPNDWVRATLTFHETGQFPVTGEIVECFGESLPASVDVSMVANEYDLVEEHPEGAEREARSHRLEVPGKDLQGREDLRKIPFITIDGETARDFDDAIYVEKEKSGYVLWVAIADVSHYVTHGSQLDQSARSRGTSVYFPERAFHMLPRALSENLCSLKPNEPRLAMVAKMRFNFQCQPIETEVMEAVIESHRRATYNQIEAEWTENKKNKSWEFAPHFELYQMLRKMRSQRGSIDFDLPEADVLVEPNGEVVSIGLRSRLDAHRLIEEFMIAANEAVTKWMMDRSWPFVYRIHEEPAFEALSKFQKLAATVGVRVSLEDENYSQVFADLVKRLDGHPAQEMLNMALLRSMKQAVYSASHGIHFGLASPGYTHFTSPIRRYPDLVVHRLMRQVIQIEKKKRPALKNNERDELQKELEEITEHCSYRERLAADAERESIKIKQVRIMMKNLGNEFEAKIVGMTENGVFVRIESPYVEGMVSRDSMTDDFYQFNEERMIFYGRRKKRTFKMGDTVKVRAVRADLDRRQIDFGMLDMELAPGKFGRVDMQRPRLRS